MGAGTSGAATPGFQRLPDKRAQPKRTGKPKKGGVHMKLEHSTKVTSDGKRITTSTWNTDSGKTTSQNITSTDLKSGKVTTTNVSGGKLLP
jgi:hypothetical protein